MIKDEYKIIEADYGWKVKCNGSSSGQFPKLEMAIRYCQTMLKKHSNENPIIDCVYKNGTIEKIELF